MVLVEKNETPDATTKPMKICLYKIVNVALLTVLSLLIPNCAPIFLNVSRLSLLVRNIATLRASFVFPRRIFRIMDL